MRQHYLDPDGRATASGKAAESHFERQLQKKNVKYRQANRHEQRLHWDYLFTDLDKKVDVKCDKRISRNDARGASKSGLICLELHGAQFYNLGWLSGEADLIAFQLWNSDYIFFNREELYKWAKMKASEEVIEYEKPPTPYQQYHRWSNKLESFMWVMLDEMKNDLSHTILKYQS